MSSNNILTINQIIQSENDFFKKYPEKDIMDIAATKIWKTIEKLVKKKKHYLFVDLEVMVWMEERFMA